jgi:hypothetical protein
MGDVVEVVAAQVRQRRATALYVTSAAANSENAAPSSPCSCLNASRAKPAPIANAAMCTVMKRGRKLVDPVTPGHRSSFVGVGAIGVGRIGLLTAEGAS